MIHRYYYNKVTGATQWDRPVELGPAPLATGWFGRGKAGSGAAELYAQLNQFYLSRPARKQKEYVDPKRYHMEGAQEYNIWYGKFIGDFSDKMDREPAADRCKMETDAGFTKADQGDADRRNKRYFCIHFAHGVCAKGHECNFYHRIPLPEDDSRTDELFDCFGRQRHAKHKDDMSGVGCFTKPCRTLFVGNLQKAPYESPKALEDALWRHFGEWGELESVNVIHRLSIAFPRFRLRTSAEFAKEAMSCQALDHGEVLSIRWAHDDPNPVARDAIQRADKDAMAALLRAKGVSITAAGFEYPAMYQLPGALPLAIEEGGAVIAEHPELAYPNTDQQFQSSSSSGDTDASAVEAKQSALARLGLLGSSSGTSSSSGASSKRPQESSTEEVDGRSDDAAPSSKRLRTEEAVDSKQDEVDEDEEEEEEEEEEAGGWEEFVDESTGAKYFFNTATGESSWTKPAELVEKEQS